MSAVTTVFTVGHSTRERDEFVSLLDAHDLREMARPRDDGRVVYPAEQAELFEAGDEG